MDAFERRLRDDAACIPADVSPELEARIRASLEVAAAERRAPARRRPAASLWWASSLTGLAAAFGLVALVNLWPGHDGPPAEPQPGPQTAAVPVPAVSPPVLRARTAVLTAPLEQELEDLEADLETARRAVREDLGL